jgi:hypothetical protein
MGFGKSVKKTYMKAKKKAYGERGVTGRYYRVGAVKGLQNLAKDVEMIKSRLNSEKKHKDADIATASLGQVYQDGDGAAYWDITPNISQGTDSDERVGNSLKLTGMSLPIQFAQQVNTLGDRKVRISVLRVKAADEGVSAVESLNQVWDVNPLTGVRDFHAPRAYRNSKNDGISVLRQMTCYVKGPHLETGDNGAIGNREMNPKNLTLNLKLNDILRYGDSSHSTPDGIKYYLIIQCNAGNSSGSNSGLDVPITDNSSGLQVRIAQRNWWIDN